MNETKDIDFLSASDAELLINSATDLRHQVLILIMIDAGLRVSEAISLRFGDFDFKKKLLNVKSLKKRNTHNTRQIPLSQRLFLSLADYYKEFDKVNTDTWLFPSTKDANNHITRDSVNKYLQRLNHRKTNIQNLHPHALRHSFATSLVATGSNLHEIADLLGHERLDTSRIYAHIPNEKLQKSINKAAHRNGYRKKWYDVFKAKRPPIVYVPNVSNSLIIGRNKELQIISDYIERNTNVILLGGIGVGKRTILDSIKTTKKVLVFDDTTSIKKSLIYMLLYLYKNDKEQVANIMFGDFDTEKMETKLSRQSAHYLCDEIKKIVQPKEFILKIRSIDNLTTGSMRILEALKDLFVIVTTAVEVAINKASFLWNFEKVEVKNLSRVQAFEMIHKLSSDMQIDDYEIFKNHILQQTDGNPRAISEMINRYRNEPVLDAYSIRAITHGGALREIDFSYLVVLGIASIAIFRYMTSELDNPGYRVIGGFAMILLIFARSLYSRSKRRTV
jgi:hypothetical protein